MSRSRKKHPATTCVKCKSQHSGKKRSARIFRKMGRNREPELMPTKAFAAVNPYDLGGDGKQYIKNPTPKDYRK